LLPLRARSRDKPRSYNRSVSEEGAAAACS
jgi:hypothetical protein